MSFDKPVSEICKACYFHIRALRHIRDSLTTEASKTIAAAIVGSRLDFCNSLLAGTSVSNLTRLQRVQNTLARVVAQKPRFCHLSFLICIGFRFATELVSKLPRLLLECSNLSSHPTFYLSSQDMCRREHSALLRLSQYAFLHIKPPWQLPNHFHLLLKIFVMHCQTICLPFQFFLFLEELSSITYSSVLTLTEVQNLVLKIKPAQCITLRDIAPTTATAPPGNTTPPI